ncbi:hypothetical protein [Secundilactobacillus odoratitofui]|uniref:hypothetical protein n=1 Tax=Secundilactobacillus odoratitofui TaxID=480930 RepID=UPI00209259A6|nr:hypothetical protein [Secundilactobacillus odoratitofui]
MVESYTTPDGTVVPELTQTDTGNVTAVQPGSTTAVTDASGNPITVASTISEVAIPQVAGYISGYAQKATDGTVGDWAAATSLPAGDTNAGNYVVSYVQIKQQLNDSTIYVAIPPALPYKLTRTPLIHR